MERLMMLAVFIPILWGLALLVKPEFKNRKSLLVASGAGLIATVLLACAVIFSGEQEILLFSLGKNMDIYFHVDSVSKIFSIIVTIVMPLVGFYAFEYMGHYKEEKRFFGFFLVVYGVMLALT